MALLNQESMKPDAAAADHLRNYFTLLHSQRDKHFGNARTVRQVVGESVKNQNLRLASIKKEERTPELMETLILEDVKEFEIKEMDKGPSIGFRIKKLRSTSNE
ncbi:MAG: hypothetical protein ACKOE5_06955, partial [Cytophagales bacterium]